VSTWPSYGQLYVKKSLLTYHILTERSGSEFLIQESLQKVSDTRARAARYRTPVLPKLLVNDTFNAF
jgi:hypothetical protein